MKKFLFAAIMTFVMIGMSACSKDKDLSGTSWKGHMHESQTIVYYDGPVTVMIDADMILTFTTEDAGNVKTSGTMTMDGMSLPVSETSGFNYTYDGKGEGTMTTRDSETGQDIAIRFTIDGNTLTMYEGNDTFELQKQ